MKTPRSAIDWRPAFLEALRQMPVVQQACEAAGISRQTAYANRNSDKDFATAWDDALEDGVDRAEQEAFRRAVDGHEEPVVYQGQISMRQVHNADGTPATHADGSPRLVPLTVRRYSDALLMVVLKARRAAYRVSRTEMTGADGAPLDAPMTDIDRATRIVMLLATAKGRAVAAEFGDLV